MISAVQTLNTEPTLDDELDLVKRTADIQNTFGSLLIDGLNSKTAEIKSQYGETKNPQCQL